MSTVSETAPVRPTLPVAPTLAAEKPRLDLTLLLAAAAWLIFNSHLEAYYPRSFLAADGLLGNSIFLMISGYGIQCSLARPQSFVQYGRRRLLRLYPSVLLAVILLIYLPGRHWTDWTALQYADEFAWPTSYTYIRYIVPFYGLLYVLGRYKSIRLTMAAIAVGAVIYTAAVWDYVRQVPDGMKLSLGATPELITWTYYWVAVALGALLALATIRPRLNLLAFGGLIALGGTYFALKFLMVARGMFSEAFPVLHLLVLAICVLSMQCLTSQALVQRVTRVPALGWFIAISATLTLEIYVVHQPLLNVSWIQSIAFPLNILLLAVITVGIAFVFAKIASSFRDKLEPARHSNVVT